MKNLKLIFIFCMFLVFSGCDEKTGTTTRESRNLPDYPGVLQDIEETRRLLAERYRHCISDAQKADVIRETREVVCRVITENIFPQWYGTPWDFNGTTRTPGDGAIACGYFVTTVLEDAGFKIDRVRLAQQPSEMMIKSMTSEQHIRRFSNVSVDEFAEGVREWGTGLYVVGLDIHTGFIVNNSDGVFFVHSSYLGPQIVVKEDATQSAILGSSGYRVLAKISADDRFLVKWLQQAHIGVGG